MDGRNDGKTKGLGWVLRLLLKLQIKFRGNRCSSLGHVIIDRGDHGVCTYSRTHEHMIQVYNNDQTSNTYKKKERWENQDH